MVTTSNQNNGLIGPQSACWYIMSELFFHYVILSALTWSQLIISQLCIKCLAVHWTIFTDDFVRLPLVSPSPHQTPTLQPGRFRRWLIEGGRPSCLAAGAPLHRMESQCGFALMTGEREVEKMIYYYVVWEHVIKIHFHRGVPYFNKTHRDKATFVWPLW